MTVPATSIAFNDDGTAWLLPGPSFRAPEWQALDRPCDTWRPVCNRIGPGFGSPDHGGCPDCISGRHTFPLDVENDGPCVQRYGQCPPGVRCENVTPCMDRRPVRSLRVSVAPGMILPIFAGGEKVTSPPRYILLVGNGQAMEVELGRTPIFQTIDPFPPAAKPGGFAVLVNWEPA